MKRIAICLALLTLVAGSAIAGRNRNGALVVHTNDEVIYTPPYPCDSPGLPTVCEELNPNGTHGISHPQLVWLLAAFRPETSPGVTTIQFGLDHNLPAGQGYIEMYGACGPSPLELPDQGWPDSGFGNLVAYGSPVYDHVFGFYFFTLYVDGPESYFGTRTYPSTDEAKFVDDGNPPVEDLIYDFGVMRWDGTGHNSCPVNGDTGGACCYPDGTCLMQWPTECQGTFLGWGVFCNPNPCLQPEACCFSDGHCQELVATDCEVAGGVPEGEGTTCASYGCPQPVGACCDDAGNCAMTTEEQCTGTYLGDGVECAPDICPTPVQQRTTWGRIRSDFR
jgi:hypothetical protein